MPYTANKKGFVILFTVLIASITLTIALGIASVSYREVLLSATSKDAQYSFFAADTGAECALYWDIQQAAFSQTLVIPSCGGQPVEMLASSSPFVFRFDTGPAGCALVTVDKDDPTTTKIESLGYNISCADLSANPSNSRITERAIRVTYGPGQAPDANPNQPQNPSITITGNQTTVQVPTAVSDRIESRPSDSDAVSGQ
jgi:hypothetical protein